MLRCLLEILGPSTNLHLTFIAAAMYRKLRFAMRAAQINFVRADCRPEMKKDRVYKIILKLDRRSYEVDGAECGCPAGRGPRASCSLELHKNSPSRSSTMILQTLGPVIIQQ